MEPSLTIILQLLLAHVLTEFVFQSDKMLIHKQTFKIRSWYLYVHSFLAGLLTYLILQQWTSFLVPIFIMVSHLLIDLIKLYHKKDNLKVFLLDQGLHLSMLVIAWLYLIEGFDRVIPVFSDFFRDDHNLIVGLGYLIVIFPVGFIIGKATENWQKELATEKDQNSLKKAGRYIGIFERILVLTFVISSNFSAIGFLIAAKSILRFSDTKGARKQTEYVLIGTLMSFAICIIIGLIMSQLLIE